MRVNEDSDQLCDVFATTLFLKPLAKVQTLKVFVPNRKMKQGSTDSSIGKMYEWKGIVKINKPPMHIEEVQRLVVPAG